MSGRSESPVSLRHNVVGGLCGMMAAWMCLGGWALGAGTQSWTHRQESDFATGKFEQTLVTSRGQLELSRASTAILKDMTDVQYVNAVVQAADGAIYAGTGPAGIVFRIAGGKAEPYFNTPAANVTSLLVGRGNLLYAGTGGSKGEIYQITAKDKGAVIFDQKDVSYVWAMAEGPAGQIYAATGPNGQLFSVVPGGQTKEVYKAKKEKNLLSLAIDPAGTLYAGSDTSGLVYKINPDKADSAMVLYDAEEAEISVILLDSHGNVYAATADASQARPQAGAPRQSPSGHPATKPATKAGQATRPSKEEGGRPSTGPAEPSPAMRRPGMPPMPGMMPGGPSGPQGGNAVYQIDAGGYVTEVFRKPVMILSMAWSGRDLLIGTGNEGRIYRVQIEDEVESCIARLAPKQITALLVARDGAVIAGAANAGEVHQLSKDFADKGTFVSAELDAKQLARWGRLRWRGQAPGNTSVSFATRSGNVKDSEDDTWSAWSAESEAAPDAAFQIISPANKRFVQYRVTLSSRDGKSTPRVDQVTLSYMVPNQPPRIAAFSASATPEGGEGGPGGPRPPRFPAGPGGPQGQGGPQGIPGVLPQDILMLTWQAADPNNDRLEFSIDYRMIRDGRWILLKDDVKDPRYIWDTKTVPDGWYELKVKATDEPSNPPELAETDERISDPILVDNALPEVKDVKVTPGRRGAVVTLTVQDALSAIQHVSYAVDSGEDYSTVFPSDEVYDDLEEKFEFNVREVKPGPHQLGIRAADSRGNIRYYSVVFEAAD